MVTPLRVAILTFCRKPEFLFGNTLVFKTLREGFPTAQVEVWDNASDPESFEAIRAAARAADVQAVYRIKKEVLHADWIEARVRAAAAAGERLVIVDPDVAFWDVVEGWTFPEGTLLAGRAIPRMKVYEAIVEPRLHTSFLWFPDPRALVAFLDGQPKALYDFHAFRGSLFHDGHYLRHVDTCGALFSVLAPEQKYVYAEGDLDAYDHLWIGTSPDYAETYAEPSVLELLREARVEAEKDVTRIRGLWERQEAVFRAAEVTLPPPVVPVTKSLREAQGEMYRRWAKGNEQAARLMNAFGYATQLADDFTDADTANVSTLERRSETMTRLLHVLLVEIPGNAFYRQHEAAFRPLFVNCLTVWDASNTWKSGKKLETRMFSYVLREAAGRLLEMIAYLVGGLDWSRQVTREIHDYYHGEHGVEPFSAWEAEG